MNNLARRFLGPIILLSIPLLAGFAWARTSSQPATVGFAAGSLPGCGISDYCASAEYKCPVLPGNDLLEAVVGLLLERDRTTVVSREGDYVHLTQSTAFWGFVDDIELLRTDGVVQARSESRRGPLNFGGNSRRLDEVSEQLHATCMAVLAPG